MTDIISVDPDMELVTVTEDLKWGMKSWQYKYDDHPWFLIDVHFRLPGVQEIFYVREKAHNAVYIAERLVTLLTDEEARIQAAEEHGDKYYTEARIVGPYERGSYVLHGGTPGGTYQSPE